MPIITFVKGTKEESGKSLAVAAIGTMMAIQNEIKILIISTTNRKDNLSRCFFEKNKEVKTAKKFTNKTITLELEEDVIAMARMLKSNKLDKDNISNFVRRVIKDRLDVLGGIEEIPNIDQALIEGAETEELREKYKTEQKIIDERKELADTVTSLYPKMIAEASKSYDYVLIDLDDNIQGEVRKQIVEMSTLVVTSIVQKMDTIEDVALKLKTFDDTQKLKEILLLSRYDYKSKMNSKNIARYVGKKTPVITMPYNTLFFDAAQEADVPGLLLKLSKTTIDPDHGNQVFLSEVRKASAALLSRLQELQIQY